MAGIWLPIAAIPSLGLSPTYLDQVTSRNSSSSEVHIPMSMRAVLELSTSHSDYSTAFAMGDLPSTITQILGPLGIVWAEMKSSCVVANVPKIFLNPRNKREQKVLKEIGM